MARKKDTGKKKAEKKPKVHKDLEGFEIKVNPLGEITSNYSIEQLNEFLNKNVRDKKLVHRKDLGFEPVGASEIDPEDEDFETEEEYGYDDEDLDDLDEDTDALDDADSLDDDFEDEGEDPNFDEFDEDDDK